MACVKVIVKNLIENLEKSGGKLPKLIPHWQNFLG